MPRFRPRLRFSLRTLFVLVTVAAIATPTIPPLMKWLFPPEPPASHTIVSGNLSLTFGSGQTVLEEDVFEFRATIRYTGAGDPDPNLAEIAKDQCAHEWYVTESELNQGPNQTADDAQVQYVRSQFLRDVDDAGITEKFNPAQWSISIEQIEKDPLAETQTGSGFF